MTKPTAIFAAIRGFALTNSRDLLMQQLIAKGWRVIAATCADAHAQQLADKGVEVVSIPFARGGWSPRTDARCYAALRRLYRQVQPELVHHFNAKPVLMGGLAARSLKYTRVFNTITGLGYAFTKPGLSHTMARWGYRHLMKRADAVVFQNSDDLAYFQQQQWVNETNSRLIVSSGVDTQRFTPGGTIGANAQPRVLMASRLIWQKGVKEFVEAATIAKQEFPHVRFQLAGELEAEHPDAVDSAWIRDMQSQGNVEFLGHIDNMPEVLRQIDLFVLPSWYREGAPRVALEAQACGVPVITTNGPGCREVVRDGHTGRLIAPRHTGSLTTALRETLADATLRQRWGQAARQLMLNEFDIRTVTRKYLELYRSAGVQLDLLSEAPGDACTALSYAA